MCKTEEGRIEIGVITNTHGVRGEVKVFPHTFDTGRFRLLREITAVSPDNETVFEIEHVKNSNKYIILKFAGINDLDSAARLKGAVLTIPKSLALPLGVDEYYIGDIIGCAVADPDHRMIGEVVDILETGNPDSSEPDGVYVIKKPDGREIMLPAVKEFIKNVDIANKTIIAEPPAGLI